MAATTDHVEEAARAVPTRRPVAVWVAAAALVALAARAIQVPWWGKIAFVAFILPVLAVLARRMRRATDRRTMAAPARFALALSTLAVVFVGMFSGQGHSNVTWFAAALPPVAAYILSRREATLWTLGVFGAVGFIYASEQWFDVSTPNQTVFNELALHGGLFAVLLATTLAIRLRNDDVLYGLEVREQQLQAQALELERARDDAVALGEAKALFLANMSHEIRTPLNGIIGMTDVMLAMDLAEEPRNAAKTIAKSGRSLLSVVNDVLDFSRLDSNSVSLESLPFSPFELVDDVLELFGHATWSKRIDLSSDIDPKKMPLELVGDEARLRQILINLVGNAVKFTGKGSVTVSATHEGKQLTVAVTDTGLGIPAGDIARLFEDFSQLDPSTTRKFGGTGLGLAITNRLIKLMGGTIGATSVDGEGSTFTFSVPTPASGRASVTNEVFTTSKATIVYASPFAGSRRSFKQLCQRLGHTAHCVADPNQLHDVVRDIGGAADLCLVSAAFDERRDAILQAVGTHFPTPPCLIVTSLSAQTLDQRLAKLGVDGALYTPISQQQLDDAVSVWVEGNERPRRVTSNSKLPRLGEIAILVAEDNPVNRLVIERQLEILGTVATFVTDGVAAVEHCKAELVHLVLMDVHMPKMDGLQASQLIRQARPDVRIVALTASVMAEQRSACIEAGMNDFLAKPVQVKALRAMLKKQIDVILTGGSS